MDRSFVVRDRGRSPQITDVDSELLFLGVGPYPCWCLMSFIVVARLLHLFAPSHAGEGLGIR